MIIFQFAIKNSFLGLQFTPLAPKPDWIAIKILRKRARKNIGYLRKFVYMILSELCLSQRPSHETPLGTNAALTPDGNTR